MRHQIIDFLKRELVGPDPVPPFIQSNGEEVLFELPRHRYGAGILFPQEYSFDQSEYMSAEESKVVETVGEEAEIEEAVDKLQIEPKGDNDEFEETYEDLINLANAYLPSALGLSCFMEIPKRGLTIEVKAGRYRLQKFSWEEKGEKKERKAYLRESINCQLDIRNEKLPRQPRENKRFEVKVKNEKTGFEEETGLAVFVTNRSIEDNKYLFTFSLVNELESKEKSYDNSEKCFFQVEMKIASCDGEACFFPYPEKKYFANEDERVNKLLYKNYNSYAIGHGCATGWEEVALGKANSVWTEIIPCFEMKPILPTRFDDIELSMFNLSELGDWESGIAELERLCSKYEEWINKQEKQLSNLKKEFVAIAKKQIMNCNNCLDRMREGIRLLQTNDFVLRAFQLMNQAMLMQQLRYSLPLRKWSEDNPDEIEAFRDIDLFDRKTWPRKNMGNWRPFQIAFILMNLKSVADADSKDRELVDIIWFPTGGGKTEAYLGLTAFTIFLRRLRNPEDTGTTVLMRYTLRLLTAQQFQRAAALITACEVLREENTSELGDKSITIGLWVGDSLSPNTRSTAKSILNGLKNGKRDDNPFVVLKCPWCGAQMGPILKKEKSKKRNKENFVKGYQPDKTVVFRCDDKDCQFHKKNLPLLVVDEDIYESPPDLVISTVDKFAMIPWKKETRALFGFRDNGERVSPPELIIQDELHLISGPLGSLAGHYETLVEALCQNPQTGKGPKIIASTATISRAKEQVNALYNRKTDDILLFPPQCLEAGESFFAYVDQNCEQMPGRVYVGVHASALPSHATTQVRVISALSQAVKIADVTEEKERDPYWTIINYFNSIRELGHAATLVSADIDEYIRAMWKRKNLPKNCKHKTRKLFKLIELTSRRDSGEITRYLQELEYGYPFMGKNYPVDICLATNMISVGLDIPRLGLMTVIGQPKTTSEYIQATSRVGRSADAPGLVVVIYNIAKPRDRSLYERFYSYHNKIYSYVEPTSVTPFSSPVRERALHSVVTGLVRFLGDSNEYLESPYPPSEGVKKFVKQTILERVKNIDPAETKDTLDKLDERFKEWENFAPMVYGNPMGKNSNPPLLYPAGIKGNEMLKKAWPTLTSMRNVDVECKAEVINEYPGEEE